MSRVTRRFALQSAAAAAAAIVFSRQITAAAAAAPASRPAASPGLPGVIREALLRNAAQIAPITIRWNSRYRSMTELEELARSINADNERADRMFNAFRHHRVTFQDGKYRASNQEEPREPRDVPPLNESAFDGEFTYGGHIAPKSDDGMVQTMYLKTPLANYNKPIEQEGQYLSTDVFEAMAIRLPVRIGDLRAKSPVRSEILYMLEHGAKLTGVEDAELDGRKMVRLRIVADDPERARAEGADIDAVRQELAGATTQKEIDRVLEEIKRNRDLPPKRLFVFHLDPALNYAVRRREEFWEPDTPLSRADNAGYEKLGDRDVYVLRKSVTENYSRKPLPAGKVAVPVQTHTIEVTQVNGDPKPPETFALAYNEPGAHVYVNDEKGRQTGFIVQEDGTLADANRRRPRRNPTTK